MTRFVFLLAALLVVVSSALADEAVLRQFVTAYNAGSVEHMPLAEGAKGSGNTDAREQYATLFAAVADRKLTLRNVRWNEKRATADYVAITDGRKHEGSVTFYLANGLIERIEHDGELHAESEPTLAAEYGQALDKGSTAAVLLSGGVEMNPALASLSPAGMLVLGGTMIALRQTWIRDMPLSECIAATRWGAVMGWLGGANNLAVLAGAGPAALAVGAVAGVVAWMQDYKGACVDGPVKAALID